MATFLVRGVLTQEDGVCACENSARSAGMGSARRRRAKKNNIGSGNSDSHFFARHSLMHSDLVSLLSLDVVLTLVTLINPTAGYHQAIHSSCELIGIN